MTTSTLPVRPTVLTPTGDRSPVEQAAAESIASGFEPETLLWMTFRRPDGGARIWYAWTAGGEQLGDRIDGLALAAGLDCADWLHLTDLDCVRSTRGRIETQAHPLRPLLGYVESGGTATTEMRDHLNRLLDTAADMSGQQRRDPGVLPRWAGVGPTLLTSPAKGRR